MTARQSVTYVTSVLDKIIVRHSPLTVVRRITKLDLVTLNTGATVRVWSIPGYCYTVRIPIDHTRLTRWIRHDERELGDDRLVADERLRHTVLIFRTDTEVVLFVRFQTYHVVMSITNEAAQLHPVLWTLKCLSTRLSYRSNRLAIFLFQHNTYNLNVHDPSKSDDNVFMLCIYRIVKGFPSLINK